MTSQSNKTLEEAFNDKEFWGRLVESAIGAYLLNEIRGTQIELYYWREKNQEVDFVLKKGSILVAIEVKSSEKKEAAPGLDAFDALYHPHRLLLVGKDGIPIDDFLKTPVEQWMH